MSIRSWVSQRKTPLQRAAYRFLIGALNFNVRGPLALFKALYSIRVAAIFGYKWLAAKLLHEPMLRANCSQTGARLTLYDDMPNILGSPRIVIGSNVGIEGDNTWVGGLRDGGSTLRIGDDVYIGFQVQITVGHEVSIGNNVMISNRVILSSFDGHPLDPIRRAKHEPPDESGFASISVGDYAWLGANCKIMKNVSIGRGAVVAAGAVVTKDVPELSVVAGNPARVVRTIDMPPGWVT